MTKLDDMDKMPWGKYKGTVMQDVPADYLFWLWTNGKENDRVCEVAGYIRDNLSTLKQEYPDGIWEVEGE